MDFKKFVMSELCYIVPTSTPVYEMVKGKHPDSITFDKRMLTNLSLTCDYDAMTNVHQFMLRWTKGNEVKTIGHFFTSEILLSHPAQVKKTFEYELLKVIDKHERDAVKSFLGKALEQPDPLDGWINVGYTFNDGGLIKAPGGNVKSKWGNGHVSFLNDGQSDALKNYVSQMKKFQDISGDFVDKFGQITPATFSPSPATVYVEKRSRELPGMTAQVILPCLCHKSGYNLRDAIMHLNDQCRWSREKIADWLDDLHDTGQVNLEFDPWKEETDDANTGKD